MVVIWGWFGGFDGFIDEINGSVDIEKFYTCVSLQGHLDSMPKDPTSRFRHISNDVLIVCKVYGEVALQPRSSIVTPQTPSVLPLCSRIRHLETGRGPILLGRKTRRRDTIRNGQHRLDAVGGLDQVGMRLCDGELGRRPVLLVWRVDGEGGCWSLSRISARRLGRWWVGRGR